MLTLALAALLSLGPTHLHAVEVEETAQAVADACARLGPVRPPRGDTCVAIVTAILWQESRAQLYPRETGRDHGPMQIIVPEGGFGSSRIGRGVHFERHALEGPSGVALGLLVLRWKHAYTRSLRRAVELYNASAHAVRYTRAVMRVFRRVR